MLITYLSVMYHEFPRAFVCIDFALDPVQSSIHQGEDIVYNITMP